MPSPRFFYQITPEYGVGYFLGIAGAVSMLLLLVYPLKKRVRAAWLPLPTRFWFRTHMQLGVIGPLLIFAHSKLNLGSINSTMAFISMVTVMVSGFIGRFLYQKVHTGLYGRRRDLGSLLKQLEERVTQHEEADFPSPALDHDLAPQIAQLSKNRSIQHLVSLRRTLRRSRLKLDKSDTAAHQDWLVKIDVLMGQCISLSIYERLFSMWHYLHLPIFFAFVIATVIHIFAVHIY